MEVHPPEHGIHSWRDFWVHLGTITVGLLIAIGLEQSVEALHRVHERHTLQRELRDEGLRNRETMRRDLERLALQRSALVARRKDVDQMMRSGGKLKLEYRAIPDTGTIALPSEATWDSAKASGRVGLLPDVQTDIYSFLYLQDDWLRAQVDAWFASILEKTVFERRFEAQFEESGQDSTPDLAQMSVDELGQYSQILDREITQRDSVVGFLQYFAAVNEAVLDGAASQEEVIHKVDDAMKTRQAKGML